MDVLKVVFECEYCYSLLDSLITPHNCPGGEAPSILRAPPQPEFRIFLDSLPNNRVFVIRGQFYKYPPTTPIYGFLTLGFLH